MAQVVAVADHPRRQARFAKTLSAVFSAAGFELQLRTQRELVAEASIEQLVGHEPIVDPDRPLLWLSPGDADQPTTPDGRFLRSESYAAARSIAMLTRSPVLNRPSAVSTCGTFPPSRPLAVRRARHHDLQGNVRAERFTGSWLPDGTDTRQLEVHDYATGRSYLGRPPESAGPFRRRMALHPADLVKIRVVGDRTITTADVAPATLAASRLIVAHYGLDLATLWWLIGKGDGSRTLARVDCWAFDAGLDADLDEVAEGVVEWTTQRLGWSAGVSR